MNNLNKHNIKTKIFNKLNNNNNNNNPKLIARPANSTNTILSKLYLQSKSYNPVRLPLDSLSKTIGPNVVLKNSYKKTDINNNKMALKPFVGLSGEQLEQYSPKSLYILVDKQTDQNLNRIKIGPKSVSQLLNNTNSLNIKDTLMTNKQLFLNLKNNNGVNLSKDIISNISEGDTSMFKRSGSLGLSSVISQLNTSSLSSITSLNRSSKTLLSDHLSKQYKLSNIANDHQISYQFTGNKNFRFNLISFLENAFFTMSSIISRPIFDITHDKITIHLFLFNIGSSKNNNKFAQINKNRSSSRSNRSYSNNSNHSNYSNNATNQLNFLAINKNKLELICAFLSKYIKKTVVLDLVKIHNPIFESNILSKIVAPLTYKMKFYFIFKKFLSKIKMYKPLTKRTESQKVKFNRIPSFISGISLKLAGRALRQPIRPKFTVQQEQQGSVVRGKVSYLSKSRFTTKNKRGTFSITVSIGQNFF